MIKNNKWIIILLLVIFVILLPCFCLDSHAKEDPMIIVSLGDSFSSGEGLTPYYGQDQPLKTKVKDRDWLAHRSTISWPALLEVPGFAGTMSDYRQTGKSTESCQWYFVAAGGAHISDLYSTEQAVKASKVEVTSSGTKKYGSKDYLPSQISIFDQIEGEVDYVTVTIGGNDVGFGELVKTCAKHSTYLGNASIKDKLEDTIKNVTALKNQLTEAYRAIAEAAGPQATIIVVGYPKLLDETGKGSLYSKEEARAINSCVTTVNKEISKLVDSLKAEGMNICFVSVEEAFDADGGHQAYSKDPWITGILMGAQPEALNDSTVISGSSMHPTAEGARAYARCVNAKIRELEEAKNTGASAEEDPMIIVSLGDSYSSGEGLTPYYGQDQPLKTKVKDRDWLAHRSTISWPALLEVPGFAGTMSDYRQTGKSTESCQWYFVAAGGAHISDLYSTEQAVKASKVEVTSSGTKKYGSKDYLPSQISIFDQIEGEVDYVTVTIGGNDVGFGELVKTCAKHSTYLGNASIKDKLKDKLKSVTALKGQLTEAYRAIAEAAGPQATIIVVGYPKMLDETGKGSLYSKEEARAINSCVTTVNKEISKLVDSLKAEGMNICFVSVEEAFDADGGHQAYSKDPWITDILMGAQPEALNDSTVISGSSMHPTAEGARAYARCVNAKIKELEEAKKTK